MEVNLSYHIDFRANVKLEDRDLLGRYANYEIVSDPEKIREVITRAVTQLVSEGILHLVTGMDVTVELASINVTIWEHPENF